jgi:hypothetical protein
VTAQKGDKTDPKERAGITRGRCTFRQKDVTRALRAAAAAGIEVQQIEIETGKITLVTGKPKERIDEGESNEWDNI